MKKKNKESFLKALSNNFYMLRLLWKACPWKILYTTLITVLDTLLGLVNLYFLRCQVSVYPVFDLCGLSHRDILRGCQATAVFYIYDPSQNENNVPEKDG